jgi:hypothetical protein
MTSYLSIATITATIQRTLQSSVQMDIEGARVTTVRPSDVGNGTPETGVNVFLYHVVTNPALHNLDSIPSRWKTNPIKRQAALDLYYMFSFYGNEGELEPQRLLGSVVRTLNDKNIFSSEMIQDTCRDVTFAYLQDSTLADQVQQISISPLDMNLEDLSKAWSVFFQTPYLLSVAYKVLVVLVEGEESAVRALPVRSRNGGLTAFPTSPQVDQVSAATGRLSPILTTSSLVIRGKNLKGPIQTQVRLCGVEVTPSEITTNQLTVPLALVPPDSLQAGVQSLQVLHPLDTDRDPRRIRRGAESNAAPFVLRPHLLRAIVSELEEVDEGLYNAQVTLQLNPAIGPQQRVVAVLNVWSSEESRSYLFEAEKRSDTTSILTVPIQEVQSGEYLIRVLVDGAESQLQVDDDTNSPTYDCFIGPRIQVS